MISNKLIGGDPKEILERINIPIVVERMAKPKEIANVIVDIKSDEMATMVVSEYSKLKDPQELANHIANPVNPISLDLVRECETLGWKEPLVRAKGRSTLETVNTAVREAIQRLSETGRPMESSMRQAGNKNKQTAHVTEQTAQRKQLAIR